MGDDSLPTSRLGRLARFAALGTRAGAGKIAAAFGSGDAEQRVAHVAAEALGTMRGLALKVGQMASYVDGFVPEEHKDTYENAMRRLRDAAPTMSPEAAARVVTEELGGPPESLFASFSREPFASASIGQVHRAALKGGREVAVKVQYEGVARAVEADLSNASTMGTLLGPLGSKLGVKEQMAEMRARFMEELDYAHEASRQRAFGAIFEGHGRVRVPAVIADLSASRVLTTELAAGISLEEACARGEEERAAWAETLWTFVFESLLGHGLFNADPHPGNYLFIDGAAAGEGRGGVWFLDFGCTRALRPEKKEAVRAVHRAAVLLRDATALEDAALDMMDMPSGGEQGRLSREYIRDCFAPLLAGGPYRITRDYAGGLYKDMKKNAVLLLKGSRKEWQALPAEWLFFNRLQLGFYSVLARLDVAVDYQAIERRILAPIYGQG